MKKFPKDFQNFNEGGFLPYGYVVLILCSRLCSTNSGCSEPHFASGMRTFSLSPLPDRNSRKLVINGGGMDCGALPSDCTPVECVIRHRCNIVGNDPCVVPLRVKRYLLTYDIMPYTSAEIPSTKRARSRTFRRFAPPNPPKNFPVRQPPTSKQKEFLQPNPAVAVQEVRGDEGGLEGEGHPPKGGPSPSKVFPYPSPSASATASRRAG